MYTYMFKVRFPLAQQHTKNIKQNNLLVPGLRFVAASDLHIYNIYIVHISIQLSHGTLHIYICMYILLRNTVYALESLRYSV